MDTNKKNNQIFQDDKQNLDSYKYQFRSLPIRKQKYMHQKRNRVGFVLWPFFVIIPIFFIGFLLRTMGDEQSTGTIAAPNVQPTPSPIPQEIQNVFDIMPHTPPLSIQENILSQADFFARDLAKVLANTSPELLWLVDKTHALSPEYVPSDLENLDDYSEQLLRNRNNHQLRRVAIDALLDMVNVASQENIDLLISSAYRSYKYQNTIFNRIVQEKGEKEAVRESARPGTSQHQLGTAIDFGSIDASFAYTPAGIWLAKNASQFGFSMSYPENKEAITGYIYESWHFRFIGITAALFTDIYFEGNQQYALEFINSTSSSSILKQPIN